MFQLRQLSILPALALLACTGTSHAALDVSGPWIREAPPGAGVMAGYLTLANHGTRVITITAANSEDFERVEFHETRQREDGVTTMRRIHVITVPSGQEIIFSPGGQHLMLIGPRRELRAGDSVHITLELDDDTREEVTLPVRRATHEDPSHQHKGH